MTHLVNHWTPNDDKAVRFLRAAGMSWADIGEALGRSWASVKERYYELRKGGRPKGATSEPCRRHPLGQDPCIGLYCKELPREQRRRVNRKAGYFLCEGCRKACQTVYDGRA